MTDDLPERLRGTHGSPPPQLTPPLPFPSQVTDDLLALAFAGYASFAKAKIVRDKHTMKSKGFGFVSFMDPFDCAKV